MDVYTEAMLLMFFRVEEDSDDAKFVTEMYLNNKFHMFEITALQSRCLAKQQTGMGAYECMKQTLFEGIEPWSEEELKRIQEIFTNNLDKHKASAAKMASLFIGNLIQQFCRLRK